MFYRNMTCHHFKMGVHTDKQTVAYPVEMIIVKCMGTKSVLVQHTFSKRLHKAVYRNVQANFSTHRISW